MRIVGTNHRGYANDRNIADLPFQRYRVVRCRNAYRLPNFLYFKAKGAMHPSWPFLHWDGGMANYDLLHFFNGISLGKKPWLSTFETFLPRWAAYGNRPIEKGLEKMAGNACKRLIALSHCTAEIQRQFLDGKAFSAEILQKVSVLQPPQAALIADVDLLAKAEERQRTGKIRLAFVGADFFRKGGLETLRAVNILLKKGLPLQLEIVSAMNFGDYASQSTSADLAEAMQIIQAHPQAIFLHRNLPNSEVLGLFRRSDVGLLPTWADTYGYSALEAMAAGCAVVSTDIRALPEINDTETGWLIPTEKDSWGNAMLGNAQERKAFSLHLEDQLLATFEEMIRNPVQILTKSQAGLKRIREKHDPGRAATTLEEWYDQALGLQ
jgi:glycosyltransferase involved in cell wall biosynthesis